MRFLCLCATCSCNCGCFRRFTDFSIFATIWSNGGDYMTKFKSVDIRRFTRSIVRWLPEINPEFVYDTLLKLDRRFTAEDIPQYVRYFENCLYGKGGDSMLDMEKDSVLLGYYDFCYACCFEYFTMAKYHFNCLSEDNEIQKAFDSFLDILYERMNVPKGSYISDEKIAVFGKP